MNEKTPNFNAKMNEILAGAKPGKKVCRETGEEFEIRKEDIDFYKEMMVPLPTLTPWVRQRQRYGYVSDSLFKTKSALSDKEIIATVYPESPLKVYANDEWWSDSWAPTGYGINYDSSKSFFEQFYNLKLQVPRPAKAQGSTSENSEWGIGGLNLKNCYMYFDGVSSENVLYSVTAIKTRDSVDVFNIIECELCYDVFESVRCYQCRHLESSDDCINCSFGFDLHNCENCFGCVNLIYKKYCFFNEQLTKEAYEEKMKGINLGSRKEVGEWAKKFDEFRKQHAIQQNARQHGSENCIGDDILDCKNSFMCFWSARLEDCAYCNNAANLRSVFDADGSSNLEYSIAVVGVDLYNVRYCSDLIYNGSNSEYCELCYNIENCFGCVGLRNKKFHILNKEYSEEEYWKLVDKIKCDMLDKGEYGESMPIKYGGCQYDATIAQHIYPITEAEAQKLGIQFSKQSAPGLIEGIDAETLPDDIADASPDVVGKTLVCAETKQPFRIIKEEFELYKKMNVPLPVVSYQVRKARQYEKFQAPKLFKGNCAHCGKEIDIRGVSMEKQRAKIVCNDCYLKATR